VTNSPLMSGWRIRQTYCMVTAFTGTSIRRATDMSTTAQAIDWGPLSEPIHTDIPSQDRPWRDNAFLSFWDSDRDVYGVLHTSTSPNAEGRRARISVQAGTTVLELVEPLEPGTFASDSISFAAGATFAVDSPRIRGEVTFTPLHALADYTGDRAPMAFSLDKRQPLMHYQRAATVKGSLVLDGREVTIDGTGFRDRTWGYRDESESVGEYFGFQFVFPRFAVNAMRLLGGDGNEATIGFLLSGEAVTIEHASLTRDASGLFAATRIALADGRTIEIRATDRHAGFWCPMGWEREGPTLGAYDEFCSLRTSEGEEGIGLIEQGIVKRLF
jgi:hypothetical protein